MSTWYGKIVDDLGSIIDSISYYEKELNEAKYECRIKGSLEKSSSALPGITEHRFNQLQEIEREIQQASKQLAAAEKNAEREALLQMILEKLGDFKRH